MEKWSGICNSVSGNRSPPEVHHF